MLGRKEAEYLGEPTEIKQRVLRQITRNGLMFVVVFLSPFELLRAGLQLPLSGGYSSLHSPFAGKRSGGHGGASPASGRRRDRAPGGAAGGAESGAGSPGSRLDAEAPAAGEPGPGSPLPAGGQVRGQCWASPGLGAATPPSQQRSVGPGSPAARRGAVAAGRELAGIRTRSGPALRRRGWKVICLCTWPGGVT